MRMCRIAPCQCAALSVARGWRRTVSCRYRQEVGVQGSVSHAILYRIYHFCVGGAGLQANSENGFRTGTALNLVDWG